MNSEPEPFVCGAYTPCKLYGHSLFTARVFVPILYNIYKEGLHAEMRTFEWEIRRLGF